jgi:hypothetical protein
MSSINNRFEVLGLPDVDSVFMKSVTARDIQDRTCVETVFEFRFSFL